MGKHIAFFGEGPGDKNLQGNKGYCLDLLTKKGYPVPKGFTIFTTGANENQMDLWSEVKKALKELEKRTERKIGSRERPLLVSVRSGAPVSMPGMMESLLNVGFTPDVAEGLAEEYSPNFAYGTLKDFLTRYAGVVRQYSVNFNAIAADIPISKFLKLTLPEEVVENITFIKNPQKCLKNDFSYFLDKQTIWNTCLCKNIRVTGTKVQDKNKNTGTIEQVTEDYLIIGWPDKMEIIPYDQLPARWIDWRITIEEALTAHFNEIHTVGQLIPDTKRVYRYLKEMGIVPPSPDDQIYNAIRTVFKSWNSKRAKEYRAIHHIPSEYGTAVNIMQMVYGNTSQKSGTAVVFSSNPKTSAPTPNGEYLTGSQGEALVSGVSNPRNITILKQKQPKIFAQIETIARKLEEEQGMVQDIELTWEKGNLYVLQTRDAALTPAGRINFLLRKLKSGQISEQEFLKSISIKEIESIAPKMKINAQGQKPLGKGIAVVEGIVTGNIVVNPNHVAHYKHPILCRPTTSPDDIQYIKAASGVVTANGGAYSHAALVAATLQKATIVGCKNLQILPSGKAIFGQKPLSPGSIITLDAYSGNVYEGEVTATQCEAPVIQTIRGMASEIVKDLPGIYELQCVADFSLLPADAERVVYSIDADCLASTGLITGKKYSQKTRRLKLKENIAELCARVKEKGIDCTLQVDRKFSPIFKDHGIDDNIVYGEFFNTYENMTGKDDKKPLGESVILKPWAITASYLLAAQKSLGVPQ